MGNLMSRFAFMRRFILILSILINFGCAKKYHSYISDYQFNHQSTIPDYRNSDYWAAYPWKKDLSDSVPQPLLNEEKDSLAEVFFIHPTTYTTKKMEWNADINDAMLNAKTGYTSILYQSSVFNQHCRIFAPRYRQVHLSAFFVNNAESKAAFDTAYADLKRAFSGREHRRKQANLLS